MRHGRLYITMLAALAVVAVGPAYAAAATSSVVDDSAADFGAGTTTATAAVAPGSVRLDSVEPFDGTTLPADFAIEQQFDPAGTATAANGQLAVDAALVHSVHELVPDQVLEFRGTFGTTAALQHAGLAGVAPGSLNGAGPWAIFSTGSSGGGLSAYTRNGAEQQTPITDTLPAFVASDPHTYRIEWSANAVSYFVDGTSVAVHNTTIAGSMHAVVSDKSLGGDVVGIDSLDVGTFPQAGAFESRVLDTADATSTFGVLDADVNVPPGTAVAFQTRSGSTPTPSPGDWSDWAAVANHGTVASPGARFIQYRAVLTTTPATSQVTPSVNSVQIAYTVASPPSSGGGTGGGVAGGTGGGATGGTSTTQQSGTATVADKTKPKVTVVAKSLKASKKGAVSFAVGCPATEQSCKITVRLKNGKKTAASKTVNVKGGKSKTVTLTLDTATRKLLAKRHTLKVSTVVTAVDAAGNKRTTTKQATLRRAAG